MPDLTRPVARMMAELPLAHKVSTLLHMLTV